MNPLSPSRVFRAVLACAVLAASPAVFAQTWSSTGPDGGDARSFAADPSNPQNIFMGTASGWIYQSSDGGASWKRLSQIDKRDDLVLDNLVIDSTQPAHIFAAGWVLSSVDGGLFESTDAGQHWTHVVAMDGESIRALAQSHSDPKIYVAGTLKGVYRSTDGGHQWSAISPAGSKEIHEVESIAIDPMNPEVIYAGTWHLPWKTEDGGKNWHNIKEGLIDDSDVFSIIIDPVEHETVYTSACSGIYKSTNGGAQYHKVQGIPATARRTRVLMQDPVNRNVVYAGTTQGLYKTTDAGQNWARVTGADTIVNDVFVDPRNPKHVLLATDRSGILLSGDEFASFAESNSGFSQRQVAALLVDGTNPQKVWAGVLNDKIYGGVFASEDGGNSWKQRSIGLNGRDVYSLLQVGDRMLAGTNGGIMAWDGKAWQESNKTVGQVEKTVYRRVKKKRVKEVTKVPAPGAPITSRVSSLARGGDKVYAATDRGLFVSSDQGATWEAKPALSTSDLRTVGAADGEVVAASIRQISSSTDDGQNWQEISAPKDLSLISAIEPVATGQKPALWVGGREGLFSSDDGGGSWKSFFLPVSDINSIYYDPSLKRLLVTSWRSSVVFAIDPQARTWKTFDTGFPLRRVRWGNNRLIAASRFDGVVLQTGAASPSESHSGTQ